MTVASSHPLLCFVPFLCIILKAQFTISLNITTHLITNPRCSIASLFVFCVIPLHNFKNPNSEFLWAITYPLITVPRRFITSLVVFSVIPLHNSQKPQFVLYIDRGDGRDRWDKYLTSSFLHLLIALQTQINSQFLYLNQLLLIFFSLWLATWLEPTAL